MSAADRATAAKIKRASLRRRARHALRREGFSIADIAVVMESSETAVQRALRRDRQHGAESDDEADPEPQEPVRRLAVVRGAL